MRLAPIATDGVRELLTYDEMEIDTLGDPDAKVAIFGILSDTDKTLSFLFAILMWQTIDQLCRKALSDYGGKLPTPVHFIFDEFANIGTIPQIEETIAVTRSRNIGITIILQSMSQLESKYDKKAQTIIDCCDSTLFLGGKSNSTNKEIAEMIGKQTIHQMTYNESTGQSSSASKNLQIQGRDLIDAAEIGKMSRLKAILLIAGTNPLIPYLSFLLCIWVIKIVDSDLDVIAVCFPSERSKGFRDFHKRLHLTREDALRFPRIEHFDAIGVQELHELVQVRPLLREFVCRLFQRLGVDDLDCRIVRIDE